MNPASAIGALSVLSSPVGIPGGGSSQLPSLSSKSNAESALNSSGSVYNLSSGTAGDLIVGGSKQSPWILIGAGALILILLLRK